MNLLGHIGPFLAPVRPNLQSTHCALNLRIAEKTKEGKLGSPWRVCFYWFNRLKAQLLPRAFTSQVEPI